MMAEQNAQWARHQINAERRLPAANRDNDRILKDSGKQQQRNDEVEPERHRRNVPSHSFARKREQGNGKSQTQRHCDKKYGVYHLCSLILRRLSVP